MGFDALTLEDRESYKFATFSRRTIEIRSSKKGNNDNRNPNHQI